MPTITDATRTVEDTQVPAAGDYTIDPAHSSVQFVVKHLMFAKVRGSLAAPAGTFTVGDDPSASHVDITLDPATVDTGEAARDGHLRSADFFDVETYPTIRFVSTEVHRAKGDRWAVTGDLTIKGTTRPVTLDVEFGGAAIDPWGNTKLGFSATTEINRDDWGLSWNQALETGGVLVGKSIKIEIEVEAAPAA